MASNANKIVPVSMAVILHVVLFGSMFVGFDWARPTPDTRLAIQATLVTEIPEFMPPPVVEKQPEPVIEAPPPEPDNSEQLRREAEEERRVQDALIEKQRLEKIRLQEEADRKRREREDAEQKRAEEVRKERERQQAEEKRQQDIQRQRDENERLRKELEAEQHQAEIDAEATHLAAVNSGELAVYMTRIRQKIERNWSVPASVDDDLRCSVRVRQTPGGDVMGVTILSCNGDEAVERSIVAAIEKSSPLPTPENASLFDRNILLNLSKRQAD